MKYTVTFVQYHTYEVEADSESEAETKAYKEFTSDMWRPVARTCYDDIEIECDEEVELDCDGRCLNCDYYETDDCPDRK